MLAFFIVFFHYIYPPTSSSTPTCPLPPQSPHRCLCAWVLSLSLSFLPFVSFRCLTWKMGQGRAAVSLPSRHTEVILLGLCGRDFPPTHIFGLWGNSLVLISGSFHLFISFFSALHYQYCAWRHPEFRKSLSLFRFHSVQHSAWLTAVWTKLSIGIIIDDKRNGDTRLSWDLGPCVFMGPFLHLKKRLKIILYNCIGIKMKSSRPYALLCYSIFFCFLK